MTTRPRRRGAALLPLLLLAASGSGRAASPALGDGPTAADRAGLEAGLAALSRAIADLPAGAGPAAADIDADVEVFRRAADRALRPGGAAGGADLGATRRVIDRGLERARALAGGRRPWASARGSVARGFVSALDGSAQPYAVVVPEGVQFGPGRRAGLDVVLHDRDPGLSMVRFLDARDGRPDPGPPGPPGSITLHAFGRGDNGFRGAGEADVFEAVAAVRRAYPVDDRRVTLRGLGAGGGEGAWRLGLRHPSFWAAVRAGSDLPGTVGPSCEPLNAWNVPIACEPARPDAEPTAIDAAFKALGLGLRHDGPVRLGVGFPFLELADPAGAPALEEFLNRHAAAGVDRRPVRVRFAATTTRYGRAAWLSVERLRTHGRRAEVDAEVQGQRVVVRKAENVAVLAVDRHAGATLEVDGAEFPLESAADGRLPAVYFRRGEDGWRVLDYGESRAVEENADLGKRRGLQGPIDDAFTGSFLCVRPTGTPWSPAVARSTGARLEGFLADWSARSHGEARVKLDTEVTPDDLADHHLILFGDPGSNRWIARALDGLPLRWSRAGLSLGGRTYSAADHAPLLIAPNPLNPRRYLVLNSGPTLAGAPEGDPPAPRLGDYAVIQTDGRHDTVRAAGEFDEGWSRRPR